MSILNKNLFTSDLDKFRILLLKKHSFILVKRDKNYWIKESDVFKMLEIDWLPKKYFDGEKKMTGYIYYLLDDVMEFVKNSVNDVTLENNAQCKQSINKTQKTLWRNCHYVIDYHKPMGWFTKQIYPEQVKILVEIVENILDKIPIRGINEFELSRCTEFNLKIDYFIELPIPLLIEINEKTKKSCLTDDIENLQFKIIKIDANSWSKNKKMYCALIEDHIKKFYAIKFLENIITKSDELKDIVDELGNDISLLCCTDDQFKFPLSKCLKKFSAGKKSLKYADIMAQFVDVPNSIMSDHIGDDDLSDLSDSSSESSEDDKNVNFDDTLVKKTKRVIFIRDVDYLFKDDEYYLNMATLIQVAVTSGERKAYIFIEKSLKLINFISTYGKTAYEKLLKDMSLSLEDRKKMFKQHRLTVNQEKDKELIECKRKIKDFENYMNINDNHKAITEEIERKYRHIIDGYKNTIIEMRNEITNLKKEAMTYSDDDVSDSNSETDHRREVQKSLKKCAKKAKVKAGTLMTNGRNYLDDGYDGFLKSVTK
jgi:hypothetical protein